jgi:hypothetical protein
LEYVCIIFAAIGLVTVIARTYSRLFITKAFGLDDGLVVIALGFLTALVVLVVVANKHKYNGLHIWDTPLTGAVGGRINIWASLWCYIIGITLIKISVLLFYRRLSVKFSRAFLIATWVGIIYNILYFFSFGLTLLLLCQPLHSFWDSFSLTWVATHDYSCAGENAALPASSAFSVLGDFYSTVLPLILVYHLDLPKRQKVALYILFAMGFMAVAAGIVRTVLMYRLLNVDYDFTWELWLTWIWAVVELYLALFAASAPSLKPFFRHFFVESMTTFSRASRKQVDQSGMVTQESVQAKGVNGQQSVSVTALHSSQVGMSGEDLLRAQSQSPHSHKHISWYASNEQERGMIPMSTYNNTTPTHHPHQYGGDATRPIHAYELPADGVHARSSTTPSANNVWPLNNSSPAVANVHHEPHEFLPSSRHASYTNNL